MKSHQLSFFEDELTEFAETPTTAGWHEKMLDALQVNETSGWPDSFGRALRQWANQQERAPIRTLSLFSGGGGLDIAFRDAGFDIVEMVEIEERYAQTLCANLGVENELGQSRVRCLDIRDYQPEQKSIELIIGGPPCQTFSAAGRRAAGVRGTADPRGTLFEEYVRILNCVRPRAFLFENVYGIVGAEKGQPWRDIQTAFRDAGYKLAWRVLDAADYGVPQHRERLFIVGVREDVGTYQFPCPTHGPDAQPPRQFYTAFDAVNGANESDSAHTSLSSTTIGGRYEHLIEEIPPGLNYSFYSSEMGHPTPVFAWRSKFSDFMYKADPQTPVRTIKAQGGLYTGPFSWENRHFTVAEMKRLQTFPDDYQLIGNRKVCIEQIGNSVPPQIGRILALSVLQQLFEVDLPVPLPTLPENYELGFRNRKRGLTQTYAAKARQALAKRSSIQKSETNSPQLKMVMPHCEVRHLSEKFELKHEKDESSFAVSLRYELTSDGVLCVEAASGEDYIAAKKTAFQINFCPAKQGDWPLPWESICLIGATLTPLLYSSLWKAVEDLIATEHHIADLVQLSGYYQYKPRVKVTLETKFEPTDSASIWSVLPHIVRGEGVANTLSDEVLAQLWDIEIKQLMPILGELRALGYETRSHRTNPQIPQGEFLVPYTFPTLNARSIQGRKKL